MPPEHEANKQPSVIVPIENNNDASLEFEKQQQKARAAVRPIRLANWFVNHTKKTCAVSLTLPILALLIILASGALKLSDVDNREYFIRNDERTELYDARAAARDDYPFLPNGSDVSSLTQLENSPAMSITLLLRGKESSSERIATLDNFENAQNILTPQIIAVHKKVEDEFLNSKNYSKFCLKRSDELDCSGKPRDCSLISSYLNHPNLYGETDSEGRICGRRSGNAVVSNDNFTSFLSSMFGNDPYNMKNFFDANVTSTKKKVWASKSTVHIGAPLPGFNSTNDRESEQSDLFTDWAEDIVDQAEDLSTSAVDIFPFSSTLANSTFSTIIIRDLSFAVIAIILVFIVIWIHTSSFVLSTTAIVQVLLSFPFAFFFYHFVFRQFYFSTLQILTIFLLLGIGADDVFVFTDAWKQSAVVLGGDVDLVTRMTWTYKRAVRAMTVTSFTTAAAFFVTATSPIMPISTLGVWAGILVLLQFVLVITVYPCVVVIWHRFWRERLFVRMFRKPEPEELDKELATPFWHRILPKSIRPEVKIRKPWEYRSVERFFRGPWLKFIEKARFILIALCFILIGLSIWLATGLQTPKETESFLPPKHPILVASDTLTDGFPRSDVDLQLRVWVSWGIKDVNRTGTTRFDVSELGTTVFDTSMDLKKKSVQEHILKACSFFGNQTDLIFQDKTGIEPVECWIQDYAKWRETNLQKTGFEDFKSDEDLAKELLRFGQERAYIKYLQRQRIVFNKEQTRVLYTEVGFVGSTEASAPEREMWPIYEKWQSLVDDFNNEGPSGGNKAIVTAGAPWVWQITQQTLLRSMLQGLLIMVCVALVTLIISTKNWYISVISTACIAGVICLLLGLIRALGWYLGTTESVSVIIGVGYSFDGVAHMATAYVESHSSLRKDRLRDALTELGISILFGSITTLLAGVAMTPTTIIFFTKFAVLLIATVTFSMLFALVFFPAILITIGPQNEFGSLDFIFKKLTSCFKRSSNNNDLDDAQTGNALES